VTDFRDHADAMRRIGGAFAAHAVEPLESQTWRVGRPRGLNIDPIVSNNHHYTVTWIPGRALIVAGDIGATVYERITHLSNLSDTIRLVREASMDYLSSKSTHKKCYSAPLTGHALVNQAYREMRRSRKLPLAERGQNIPLVLSICEHVDEDIDCDHAAARAQAMGALREMDAEGLPEGVAWNIADAAACDQSALIQHAWPNEAHWHYEAVRTWANLMARERSEERLVASSQHKRLEVPHAG
jgi:hypothetical protein